MKKILLITDAWLPQTNGVVTTWSTIVDRLERSGFEVCVIHAGLFRTWALPTYTEIRVAGNPWQMRRLIGEFRPDFLHIATEGPLGVYARGLFKRLRIPFTTSLHTKFPEYIYSRLHLPLTLGYRFMCWFHQPAVRTLCTTVSHKQELTTWGLADVVVWGRGVDVDRFQPQERQPRTRPRLLYVGRVSVEKNIEAFLRIEVDADKVVVGDGPAREALQARYPDVHWLGYRRGDELVYEYAQADVLVFPSRTDTFGLVLLEANACGTPVAAFPVTGPIDVVVEGVNGSLNEDLSVAIDAAMQVSRQDCRTYTQGHTWERVAQRLVDNLAYVDWSRLEDSAQRLVR
jgi:glycosyltransferase involved in cell wall biosynthesis